MRNFLPMTHTADSTNGGYRLRRLQENRAGQERVEILKNLDHDFEVKTNGKGVGLDLL